MALAVRCVSTQYRTTTKFNNLFSLTKVCANPVIGNHLLQINRGHKRHVTAMRIEFKKRKDAMEAKRIEPLPPQPRNTYAEWNHNAEIFAFGKRLEEDFDKDLLQQAFIERSYIIMEEEKQKKLGIEEPKILLKDNSDFAEIGGSFISNYVKRYLRTVYPRFPEEGICSVTDYLMTDVVLADISKNIGTSDIILTPENPPTINTLANVLKAVVHALQLSSGDGRACLFVRDFIVAYLSGKDINEIWEIKNPESLLASILQREGKSPAVPRIIGEASTGTILAAYQIGLYCDKEFIGMGFGESITVAKEMAAVDALKRLFQTTERARPIPFNIVLEANKMEPFANLSIQDWCEQNIKSLVTQR